MTTTVVGLPHGTESSAEVGGHQFTVTPISTVVRMLFSATWSSLGANMESAELGFSKVRIFQRVEDRGKGKALVTLMGHEAYPRG